MEITTHSAQINVSDREGSCGANINRRAFGYVAELHFWGDQVYLARRKGDPGLRILIMPREEWKRDLESEDFEIIGKLSDIANDLRQTPTSEDSSAVEDHIGEENKMVPGPCEIPLHDPDGWIPHKPGDPMPCEGGSRNRIRLRNGSVVKTKCPEFLYWGEIPHDTDDEIIAWKPAK